MKLLLSLTLGVAVVLGLGSRAYGHATSIGYANAGAGSVTIWLGTYEHGGHHLEGSMNLVGVGGNPFPSTTVAFTLLTGTGPGFKPAGLVDGVNNFFDPNGTGSSAPLVGVDPHLFGGVNHWQGATFTGLGAGSYQFTWIPRVNPTAEWSILNPNMNGIFDLTGVVQPTGVPDGGSSLALLGLAMVGIIGLRKK